MSQQFVQVSILVAGRNIVDPTTGKPTTDFMRVINDNTRNFRIAVSQLATQAADIEASLLQAGIALTTATAVEASFALTSSYVSPENILTSGIDSGDSTKRTVVIANHDRKYGDGTSIAVTGATLTGLTAGTFYYIYYDDADRLGGAVTYFATSDPTVPVQGSASGARHTVGSITTVASDSTTPTNGGGTTGPGVPSRPSNGTQIQ